MATNNVFILDDGTKELTIQNNFGEEICKIHVRTGDISILDRYNELLNDFDKIVAPLSGINLKSDGTSSFEEEWKVIKGVEKELVDKLNKMFDTNDIDRLFASRNAFSTIGGVFYVEKVIDMLGKVIADALEQEAKETQKRVEKYTKDFHKNDKKDDN